MNNIRRKILIADKDPLSVRLITETLGSSSYDVLTAYTGKEARVLAESHCPDLVLMDRQLPDIDGAQLLREIREWSEMPIIVISDNVTEADTVAVLDSGADDFISANVGKNEFLSRIRVALRHRSAAGHGSIHSGQYRVGGLVIDYEKYRTYIDNRDADLTLNEFKIVALLGKHAGRVLTYDYIITQLWGPNAKADNQILRVNMTNIRKKLNDSSAAPRYIFTEAGIGYRMAIE